MSPIQDRRQKFIHSLGGFLKNPLVAFLFVFGICACCKLMALNSRELWLDETYSAMVANLPFGELLRHTSGDVHPPLFYMLLWGWVRVVGDAQAQLRLFSVVLNLCSLPAMYLLARRILGGRFGAYAAMLYAFSPMLFVYSLEVRMYMLLILVFIFLLIAHWAVAVEHREEKWIVVAYSVLAAALFYIHYIAIFILLGLLIHWATTSKLSRARVLRLSATVMLTLLFISPGIPILLEQHAGKSEQTLALEHSLHDPNALSFGDGQRNIAEPTGAKVLAKSAAAMAGFFPAASPVLLLLCAIPLMVALLGAVFLGIVKGDPLCRLFLLMSLAVGSGVIALHLSSTRYLLPLIPLLVLAMARVVQYGAGRSRWLLPSIAVGSLIFCVYAAGFIRQETVRHGSPWQNLVGVVEQNYQSGDLVVFDALYSQVPFDYFAQQAQFHPRETGFPISIYSWWDEQKFKGWGGPVISRSDLDRFTNKLARPTTVWLVSFETYYYDPHNELQARLRELGQVTEFHIPAEGNGDTQDDSALRLMRVTIR